MARQIVLDAMVRGHRTAGQLIDELAGMTPAQRRGLLDDARIECGLPTTKDVDGRARYTAANQAAQAQVAAENPWQLCHEPTCNAVPVNRLGVPIPVAVKRWYCAQHAHLASADDLKPTGPRLAISPGGAIVDLNDAEIDAARERNAQATRDSQQAAREAATAAAIQEHDGLEQARREQLQRELPEHLRATA